MSRLTDNPQLSFIEMFSADDSTLLPTSQDQDDKSKSPASKSFPFEGDMVVFSGGTAANSLVDVFEQVREAKRCRLHYVIPISDNGGSTSEVIRVFGGPGTECLEALQAQHQ